MERITILITALLWVFSFTADAKVKLPSVIGDNMVLQQDTLVNIWGWASPGARVSVSPSWGSPYICDMTSRITAAVTCGMPSGSLWCRSGQTHSQLTVKSVERS